MLSSSLIALRQSACVMDLASLHTAPGERGIQIRRDRGPVGYCGRFRQAIEAREARLRTGRQFPLESHV